MDDETSEMPSSSLLRVLAGIAIYILEANTASAALTDRGGGLIYDDVLNVTWLQNANLSASESFGVAGILSDPTSSVAPGRMPPNGRTLDSRNE